MDRLAADAAARHAGISWPVAAGITNATSESLNRFAKLEAGMLREAMALRGRMTLTSYDRLFPVSPPGTG